MSLVKEALSPEKELRLYQRGVRRARAINEIHGYPFISTERTLAHAEANRNTPPAIPFTPSRRAFVRGADAEVARQKQTGEYNRRLSRSIGETFTGRHGTHTPVISTLAVGLPLAATAAYLSGGAAVPSSMSLAKTLYGVPAIMAYGTGKHLMGK